MWKFITDPDRKGFKEHWFKNFPESSVDIVVPSCWNNELGLYEYEGLAWYATKFRCSSENINLVFHAVTGQAEVYLDGIYLGGHYGGFTGFNFTVTGLAPGEHTLVVAVDNTHDNMNTIPLSRVDWFHYGGIYRSVEVMELGDVWIKDHRIDYRLDDKLENAFLSVGITVEAFAPGKEVRMLKLYVYDTEVYRSEIEVRDCTELMIDNIELKNVKLWDVGKPNLYSIRLEIGDDDVIERLGFRQIKAENGKIYLNGRELYLKGVNRHEEHPDWGFAVPLKLMKKDIDIIKNLGCNAIRGSHYPNSELFLDYLDQEGILFWEEIPMWGFPEEPLKNPLILERGLKMHEEMVKRDYHHPCIIIWSMHNEIDTRTQAAYDLTKAFVRKVRSMDETRLLSYASNHPLDDICYSLVDVISINKYCGWYGGEIESWDEFIENLKEKLDNENLSNKPLLITEFGAGAIYGDATFEAPKWTENYQEKLLKYTLELFHKDTRIQGSYIWQYADIRTSKEMAMGRPRSFNNKGIVNEYRKPKMAYWTVQKIYNGIS